VTLVLRALLRVYPAAFRERFGAEIVQQIRDEAAATRTRGRGAHILFFIATVFDLVRSGITEHIDPTWRDHLPAPRKEGRMSGTLRGWARDIRHAMRSLQRAPGFAAVVIVTLGLAIGVNAGMFTVVRAVLLDPLPYRAPDRLMHIAATSPGSGLPDEFGVSNEFFVHYAERSELIEDVAIYNSFTNTLRVGDRVERIRMSWPTSTLFSTLGVTPMLGRAPTAEDEEGAVVLSYELWSTWFGNDSTVLGQTVQIFGEPRTIIGVMGREFQFPIDGTMLWISSVIRADGIEPGRFNAPLVARVKAGVTPEELAAELTSLAKELPARFGGTPNYAQVIARHSAIVRPIETEVLGEVSGPLLVLFGAVGVVLLIACANVANLFAVRAESRHRELAVRRAIGASRGHLIQTQFAESFVLAGASALFAMVLAAITLPLFLRVVPSQTPRIENVQLDPGTLLFAAAVAMVAALVYGLIPAIRGSAPKMTWLREGSRGSTRRRSWARDGLVIGQTALALVLLIGSTLLVRSARALNDVDPGYDTDDVFTFQIAAEGPQLQDGVAYAQFALQFMERLKALPGVESVGLVENVPLNEGTALTLFRTDESGAAQDGHMLDYTFAAGDYYSTMGIDVLRGRAFVNTDHTTTARNIIVSRKAADQLWPGLDAIGRRIRMDETTEWYTVVGVVEDVVQNDLRDESQPTIYLPLVGPQPDSWVLGSPAYVVKTPRAASIANDVRTLVRDVAPEAPMYRVFTMAELASDSMIRLTFTMVSLAIVSTLALILGAVGLYGVLAYVVAQRTREIGVRLALGAEAARVQRMVVAQGTRLVVAGVIIGVIVALSSTRVLESLLFGVDHADVPTFVIMSVSMLTVGLLASWIPALRASRVDPIESLRE
jgi:putative ABC transport system permease protein